MTDIKLKDMYGYIIRIGDKFSFKLNTATPEDLIGELEFNEEDLRVEVNIDDHPMYVCLWFDPENMINIKKIRKVYRKHLTNK